MKKILLIHHNARNYYPHQRITKKNNTERLYIYTRAVHSTSESIVSRARIGQQ